MCDCKPGKTECVEAQSLHAVTGARYRVWQSDQTDRRWKDYETARDDYRAHVEEAENEK